MIATSYLKKMLILLIIGLLGVSTLVRADWKHITRGGDTGFDVYGNPSSIRKDGNLVKMWSIKDYDNFQNSGEIEYLSTKTLEEYDCKGELTRQIAISVYADNMAGGQIVHANEKVGIWRPVSPESVGEVIFKFACSKH